MWQDSTQNLHQESHLPTQETDKKTIRSNSYVGREWSSVSLARNVYDYVYINILVY